MYGGLLLLEVDVTTKLGNGSLADRCGEFCAQGAQQLIVALLSYIKAPSDSIVRTRRSAGNFVE